MSGEGGLAQYVLGAVPHGRTAIVAADGTGPLTGRALADRARRGAAGLAALGVGRGDVVALHLPNVPDFAPALCAVLRAGAAAVLCSPLATEEELTGQLALSRAAVVVTAPALRAPARAAAARAGVGAVLDLLPDRRAVESAAVPVVVRAGDPAVLALSSGTTGLPKCAVLTHGGLVANLRQAAGPLPLGTDDVLLALAPFAHVMGVCGVLLRGLAAGATVVTLDRFTPAAFLGALSRHRVTQTIVPPPLVDLLATSALVDRYDLSALRVVYVGGAGAGAELERACARRLGCVVAQGYGMTEGGPMITVNPVDGRARPGSAGLPLPGVRIRIVRDGREVPAGSSGEVHVAGPGLMAGYLGDPEATRRVLGADGWLRTGDVGHVDGEGYLWITDRLKDLIKYKGHQVSPAEVEAVLTRHPAVAEAAVVGRPDARAGEVPVAFVTLRAPASPEELVLFVAARVSAPKRIHEARIVSALPRGPTGKVLRRELRRRVRPGDMRTVTPSHPEFPGDLMADLPVVDISGFATGAAPGPGRDAVAAEVDRICRETGFFLAAGHGVRPKTRAAMFAASREFFALPAAAKNALAISRSSCHRGYFGIAAETLDEGTTGDLKEGLDTGGEHGPDHPEVLAGTPTFGPNQLPDLPGFRQAWSAYRAEAVEAAERVQRALARALGLPDDHLLAMAGGEVMYHLRLLHYPPQRHARPAPGQLGCGEHTDYGTVTLLADDGVGGLEVMRRDGTWIQVAVPEGLLVVNLGDLMAIWTNDRWVSNPHRVVNPPDTDRYSIPLFVTPPYRARITCLPSCLAPGAEPRYAPQVAGEYLTSRLDATHPYRNPLLAALRPATPPHDG